MNAVRTVAALSLLLAGCPAKTQPIDLTDAAWKTVVENQTYAVGDLFVYLRSNKRDLDRGLPGIAFGDRRGPRFGLLGGYYAPQIIAADSGVAYDVDVDVKPTVLRVTLSAPDVLPLRATIHRPHAGRAEVVLEGGATLVARADRTTIRGFYDGRPSFGFDVTAGEDPGLVSPRATTVEIDVAEDDTWRVDTACPRVRVLRPRPTGSTSVFLVAIGPGPLLSDAVYRPVGDLERHADFDRCSQTETSTFTFAWPARGR